MQGFTVTVTRTRTIKEETKIEIFAEVEQKALAIANALSISGDLGEWTEIEHDSDIVGEETFSTSPFEAAADNCPMVQNGQHDWSDGDDPHAIYDQCAHCGLIREHAETA
jgi:hypothetical protein